MNPSGDGDGIPGLSVDAAKVYGVPVFPTIAEMLEELL